MTFQDEEEWCDYSSQDEIAKKNSGRKQMFSIIAQGEAVHWINRAKKRPGFSSRGAFVSKCVAFYVRNHPWENTRGRIAYLESRVHSLQESIAGLQQVIRDQNVALAEGVDENS